LFIYSISGNKLDIKDPSAVVTQATGDIKVGKYVFVLTVKDLEETSSVVKKIVNVMERKFFYIISLCCF
jgi:hypothetical protein